MRPILTSSQKAAGALRRAEKALRNWQDDPDSPRKDVDEMLRVIADLRGWVAGHVLADLERAQTHPRPASSPRGEVTVAEVTETYDHRPREQE